MTPIELAELRDLLDALCEEMISPEQVRRLEELVLTRPDAEAYYVQYVHMFADLARVFAGSSLKLQEKVAASVEVASSVIGPRPARAATGRRKWLFWGSTGILTLAACLLLAFWQPREPAATVPVAVAPLPSEPEEASHDTVAVLVRAPGAEWEKTDLPTQAGSPLRPGLLKLKSGSAHLEFYSGATVVLEGPAEIRLVSSVEAFCARGKLRATVPPQAHGFKIGSPYLNLVDRGTEFGMVVGDRSEVHVFQGKVELYDPGTDQPAGMAKELTTGQGVQVDRAGHMSVIKSNPDKFVHAEHLIALSLKDSRRRHQEWLAACAALRKDPTLEVFYRFGAGRPADRRLLNESGHQEPVRDGTIVGCTWVAGRWSDSKALQFKQVSDRVRFHVPGEFTSLTLMAWVRVDALPNLCNSLMMCDGWKPGYPHWLIGNRGHLGLGLKSGAISGNYRAENAVPPKLLGQWIHVAAVYDQAQGKVTHYVNGRQAAQDSIVSNIHLHIGNAELGNWNLASHRDPTPIRFFTGCMDEFLIFSRAVRADEIERIYIQGQPEL